MLDKYLTVSVNARTVCQIFRGLDGFENFEFFSNIYTFYTIAASLISRYRGKLGHVSVTKLSTSRDETNISKNIISIKLKKKIFHIFQYFENIYNFLEQCRIFLYEWYCNWIKIYIYIYYRIVKRRKYDGDWDMSEFGQGTGQGEICRRNKTFDIS